MIIKPLSTSEDIKAAPLANATALAGTLVYVVNTNTTAAALITVANQTPVTVYVPAGEGAIIEKERGAVIDASTASSSVWATAVAYSN